MFWKVNQSFYYTEDEEERAELLQDFPAAVPMTEEEFYSTVAPADEIMVTGNYLHAYGEVDFL